MTIQKFAEIPSRGQMGLHQKPCALLNTAGFYAPPLQFFAPAVAEGLLPKPSRALVWPEDTPEALVARLETSEAPFCDRRKER